jgi:hypothetical protein
MIMNCRVTVNGFSVCGRAGAGRAYWAKSHRVAPWGSAVATPTAKMSRGRLHGSSAEPYWSRLRVEIGSVMVSVVPRVDGTCQPTDFATHTGVADLDALFAILEPWSVLRPWDFAWAF